MGWAFVKRRMMAELGAGWEKKFANFEHQPSAAASLGQVHRARSLDGRELACKLQYPDMQSAVEADLQQLQWLLAIRRRFDSRDRYHRGRQGDRRARARGARLLPRGQARRALSPDARRRREVRVPRPWPELSTGRLLTLDWLEGTRMLAHKDDPLAARNVLATAMFTAWWFPFSRFGVIHGDPHLGNYTVFARGARRGRHQPARLRLHPHLSRRNSCRASSTFITACFTARTISSCMPTRPGVSAGFRAISSIRSTSGRASSMRRCLTTACAPSPTASRRASTAAAKHSACIRRSSKRAR